MSELGWGPGWLRPAVALWSLVFAIVGTPSLAAAQSAPPPIAFHGAAGTDTFGNTLSIASPAGAQAGDLLIAAVYTAQSSAAQLTPPIGWSLIREDSSSGIQVLKLYRHTRGASDPGTYAWTLSSGTNGLTGIIAAYSGVDSADPIDAHGGQTGTGASASAPSITATTDGDWLVGVWSSWNSNLTLTPPSGMITRQSFNRSSPLVLADRPLTAAGPTGAQSATATNNTGGWTGQVIALRAPGGGPPSADLSVMTTPSATSVPGGTDLGFTYHVTNNGSADATSVALRVTSPTAVTQRSISGAGWNCVTPIFGLCTLSSLASGASSDVTLTVRVDPAVTAGTVLTSSATISAATADPNSANNASSASVTASGPAQADLAVTQTVIGSTFRPGQGFQYQIDFENLGPSFAESAVLVDNLPSNVSFVSLTPTDGDDWPCTTPPAGSHGGTVRCTHSGDWRVFSERIVVHVVIDSAADPGTFIENPVTFSSATNDPDLSNNMGESRVTVQGPQADLSVTKTASVPSIAAGQDVTYSLAVANSGPETASDIHVSDTLPASTTFRSLIAPAGWSCSSPLVGGTGTASCSNSSLALGASATISLVVRIDSGAANGALITNTATVSSPVTADANQANNSSTVNVGVNNGGSTGIALRSTSSINANGSLTLQIPAPAGAQPNDLLLAAIYSDNSHPNTITPPSGFTLIRTDAGATTQAVSLYSRVASTTEPTSYTFTATFRSGYGGAILAYSGVDPNAPVDAYAGQNGTGTSATAPSVSTTPSTDRLIGVWSAWNTNIAISPPSGMTQRASIATNTPMVVADKPLTLAGATGPQTATMSANPANWTAQLVALRPAGAAPPTPSADLQATDQHPTGTVQAGQSTTFQLSLLNNGPSAASSVTMTSSVPTNTTFQSLSAPVGWSCTTPLGGGTGPITCNLSGSLAAGAGSGFGLIVTVNSGVAPGTVIGNTVSFSSAVFDPNTANNSATATATVTAGGSSPIAFRASATAATTGRTLTIARPAGAQVNDVLVAAIYWDNSSPNTITPPAGFSLTNQDTVATAQGVSVYYHVVTASDPTTYSWSATLSSGFAGILAAYSGVNPINPIDLGGHQDGTTNPPTAPSIFTSEDGDLLVTIWSAWNSNVSLTPPGGMTQRALMNQCCPLTLADKQLGNAGPSGQQIATASGNTAFWTGQSIALRRIP